MGEVIELPLWIVVVGTAFAAIALVDRVLGPSVRWFFRKRFYRAIDEINDRLHLKIQPFKLTKRQVLIDRLVHDPEVLASVEEHMLETGEPREIVMAKVGRYAKETVPSFSAFVYFSIGVRIARFIAQSLYRVRIGAFDEKTLSQVDKDATVVFVMNHRSNVDYLLVTYLAADRSTLSYAVGEWARIWPLNLIIRAMGAYFIRRRSRNALYRKVLARYVRMATDGGVAQAIFLEGGLSRDGRLAPPKLGLLNYIVTGFDPDKRDVVFVPVGLNYDRVLEDRVMVGTRKGEGTPRFPVNVRTTLAFVLRLVRRRIAKRFYRFGYACVSFGEPLSLERFQAEASGEDVTERLGTELSQRIARVIPVLPVSLVASVFLASNKGLSLTEIRAAAKDLLDLLQANGAHSHVPRDDLDYAVEVGLRVLTLRKFVTEQNGTYLADPKSLALLRYYANAIAHLAEPESSAQL